MGFFRFSIPRKTWLLLFLFGALGGAMMVGAEYVKESNETIGFIVLFFTAMYLLVMSVLAGLQLSGNPNVRWRPDG